jgi:hypothetical protein
MDQLKRFLGASSPQTFYVTQNRKITSALWCDDSHYLLNMQINTQQAYKIIF